MRCKSIVGIWPETSPSHRVTAVAVLDHPLSLYTGADDGSIVWWHFYDHLSSSKKVKPVALLCGHAAPIGDLCISYPLSGTPDDNTEHLRDEMAGDAPSNRGALLSACSDGVLCVWSRGSGHCRRRRKLPPWVGSPSVVRMLSSNKRYVCIASFFSDLVHSADHDSMDSSEGAEVAGDHESLGRRPPKCTIVIVDSCTLTIIRTVFHGNLALGPLKFMAVVESVDEKQKHSALMVDSYGKIQCVSLVKDSNVGKEGGNTQPDNSSPVNITGLENLSFEGVVLSVAICGDILGLVLKTKCIFILVASATIIGVISLENSALCAGTDYNLSPVTGSTFICSDNINTSGEIHSMTDVKFSLWNDRGIAVIYDITYVDDIFKYEVISEIASISCPVGVKLSINFVQMSKYFLRIESICCHNEEPFLWRPFISIWSLHEPFDDCKTLSKNCRLLGEGNLLVDGGDKSSWTSILEASENSSNEKAASTLGEHIAGQESNDAFCNHESTYAFVQREHIVSSTMVVSQHDQVPYAVVYGYHSGEIDLVQFNILALINSDGMTLPREMPQETKQQFSGHTGPVLCLAAHHIVGTSAEQTCSWMLLSGSMDCTLRIWNLESGNPIMVMHHHVAPVRQIILPPLLSDYPWSNCVLSVGDDSCVTLVSLETLRVERMFPGHPSYPGKVVWDSVKGYLACLSQNYSVASGAKDALYIWDIKAGSRERVLRGTAAHSMFNNFCKGLGIGDVSGCGSAYNTSSSSLLLPFTEDLGYLPSQLKKNQFNASSEGNILCHSMSSLHRSGDRSIKLSPGNSDKLPIRCSCPISGIAVIGFDLSSLISPDVLGNNELEQQDGVSHKMQISIASSQQETMSSDFSVQGKLLDMMGKYNRNGRHRLCLLQFSLSLMHLWGVDFELDKLLMMEMDVKRYDRLILAPGLEGDRGSISLAFPAFSSILQLWKSSSEFCALWSLTMVSLAQSMVSLSHSYSGASSALAAFYTRNFAEKNPDVKPPSLQLLVSFWQNEDEHVRMAARSLFHCAASRAIPQSLCCLKKKDIETVSSSSHTDNSPVVLGDSQNEEAVITKWLESYELQDWVSCVNGTSQDAMASHIIVAAALAIWYPSLIKPSLAKLAVHPLMKLVMAMNEKYSSTAAELLAEGMDSTWKKCIGSEIPRLIGDIFFQIECVSGAGPVVPPKLREVLVSVLLPSLAIADVPGFLSVIEGLIWSTASDSPVHLVSLKTLIRLMRGSPRNFAQYLNKVVNFILHTMDPANSVMRKTCLRASMTTLREVVRAYPMVALNDSSTRLAVGDAVAEVNSASIHVYDMPSVTKIKVLDASGPPGLPTLFSGAPETFTTAISALSFSPDGEGLVAFSEHGLVIRWWSLGTAWWEKLSRNFVPVQCTKLILVPPWEGFSPNSSRASIMAHIEGNGRQEHSQEHIPSSDGDGLNLLLYNLDLSYKLEWVGDHKVLLSRHGHELGTFMIR